MPSLQDLLAQRAEIEKQISDAQREEHAAAVAKVKALMTEFGLTAADIAGRASSSRAASSAGTGTGRATGKVAPKFRNAATNETWSGRGLQPKWLKAAIASGAKLEDFTI